MSKTNRNRRQAADLTPGLTRRREGRADKVPRAARSPVCRPDVAHVWQLLMASWQGSFPAAWCRCQGTLQRLGLSSLSCSEMSASFVGGSGVAVWQELVVLRSNMALSMAEVKQHPASSGRGAGSPGPAPTRQRCQDTELGFVVNGERASGAESLRGRTPLSTESSTSCWDRRFLNLQLVGCRCKNLSEETFVRSREPQQQQVSAIRALPEERISFEFW
ncbi:hypothetical protein Anapl_08733 [Anas platyrhynchos]|uniref:Uncharacterized protein n=1 Tax=Anas platyrhynchos TaxID=8839 RepID=R0L3U4_ANAPL|nr:hypothetical protein Anapl_08733 [Anas platyrhynchos]